MVLEIKTQASVRAVGVAGGVAPPEISGRILKNLEVIDKELNTTSQVFDANTIAGPTHLVHAARLAIAAQDTGKCFADSPRLDLACWVAGERQIGRAIAKVGLKPGQFELAFLVVGDSVSWVRKALACISNLGVKQDGKVLQLSTEKEAKLKRLFSISEKELSVAPLEGLILERMAILSLDG